MEPRQIRSSNSQPLCHKSVSAPAFRVTISGNKTHEATDSIHNGAGMIILSAAYLPDSFTNLTEANNAALRRA